MKTLLRTSVFALLVMAVAGSCFAEMDIEQVTAARAKALGMEVRAKAAGPSLVRVELEFPIAGELKGFTRVDLVMHEKGKLMLSSSLRDESTKPGRVLVAVAVDRANLNQLTLRVVSSAEDLGGSGYDLRVADFVDVAKVR